MREAPLTDRATDVFPALQQGHRHAERPAGPSQGDLPHHRRPGRRAGGNSAEIQRALERSKSEISTHIILVNEHEEKNLGVSELRLASGLSPVNQPLRFEAKVTNLRQGGGAQHAREPERGRRTAERRVHHRHHPGRRDARA